MEVETRQRTPSVSTGSSQNSGTTRCIVTAKFEVELHGNDGNVTSTTTQPSVHKLSKHHHSNRQPKRHKRHNNSNNRY